MRPKPIVYYQGALFSTSQKLDTKFAYCWIAHDPTKIRRISNIVKFNPETGGFETSSTIYLPKEKKSGQTNSVAC